MALNTIEATDAVQPSAAPRRWRRKSHSTESSRLRLGSGLGLGIAVLWLSLVVLLPLAAVVGKGFSDGWQGFWDAITSPEVLSAFRLTVGLSLGVAVVNAVMGTLIAWVLVRDSFPGQRVVAVVIDVPFALPTIVAGLVMLTLYGGDSPIGVHLVGTRVGIFVALLFVTLPFTVRTVQPVLIDMDQDVEEAAASLGAGPFTVFRRVVLPSILPAILAGTSLSFARALGEYGSIVLISSNLPFKTEIASAIIYGKLQDADNPTQSVREAAAIATLLLLASAVVLILLEIVQRRVNRRG
ncbi:sulfate transport system permease protein [Jatrophihabitans sp. GAS493]|uniref:sulfate ABC transporter permease subunit CysT n=1 Tax=Jatrophihabitans sp. GAS493 TaxID=1907575 RepID=UPI000BB76D0C|nr:sulfate ABC transporter permease subunit CysT [Jatrophihabitans sp. GAS493]SOD74157.1 sulfate transport system permease protein [Jatrophihabitans sp. GAS493]